MDTQASYDMALRGGSFDVDALLYDLSTRSARSQLSRRISNSSSACGHRPAVTKPNSAGNSPVHIQRRRALTAHRRSRYWSQIYPPTAHTATQQPFSPADAADCCRPVSWHPSSLRPSRYNHYYSPNAVPPMPQQQQLPQALPYRPATYRTIDVHGMPTPMTQPDIGSADLLPEPWFSLDAQSRVQPPTYPQHPQQLQTPLSAYDMQAAKPFPLDANLTIDGLNPDYAIPSFPTNDAYPSYSTSIYPASTYAAPSLTSDAPSAFPSSAHTAPPTPDMLPAQPPSHMWADGPSHGGYESLSSPPALPRRNSTELVGMGLYDPPARASLAPSELSHGHGGGGGGEDARPLSGTGLKLEDAWEPPVADDAEEQDDDEGEEGQEDRDGQGGEEAEMEDVPAPEDAGAGAKMSVPSLADHSFFFEGEDAAAAGMLQSFLATPAVGPGVGQGVSYQGSVA